MRRDNIAYPEGVPRLFTYLAHMRWRRKCRREGHASYPLCRHCGQLQGPIATIKAPPGRPEKRE